MQLLSSNHVPQDAFVLVSLHIEKPPKALGGRPAHLLTPHQLDAGVHETYKNKHFPPGSYKPPAPAPKTHDPNPSNASPTVPNTAHHSLHGPPATFQSLINDFSTLSIQGEAPPTDLSPPPPCPISTIPEEILVEILVQLAIQDIASFARLSSVCKRLAYLVATEDRVWKRVCMGSEFGFGAMHYRFACQIDGKPLEDEKEEEEEEGMGIDLETASMTSDCISIPDPILSTALLVPTPYPTYATLFRLRPRIRFNGCYISTVNYTRPGASSSNSISWNSPIHIVTYYRYLRFLRDGTCISLLTTSEPADVVPFLYPQHMHKHHGQLPSAVMKDALLGRWRLSGPAGTTGEEEGVLHVETAGVTPKYLYKMILKLGSAGRGVRNNKLVWQGYWSYNKLTDDWAEFGLKNDRPFYWSRVKSYSLGMDQMLKGE